MNGMMKRHFALLLALLMCVSLFPATAVAEGEAEEPVQEEPVDIEIPEEPAEESAGDDLLSIPEFEIDVLPSEGDETEASSGQCGSNLYWSFDDSTGILTINGSGAMYDWSAQIEEPWWDWHKEITSVSLPSGLTTIGNNAFSSFTKLTSIKIPNTVSEIGAFSFYGSGITSISIPFGVTTIPEYTFHGCDSLKTVILPNSLTSIGDSALRDCDLLTTITIPESVTSIGKMAFSYDYKLTSIVFMGGAPEIVSPCFSSVTATAYYKADDPTWTEEVLQKYGGRITWVPCYFIAYDANGGVGAPDVQRKTGSTLSISYIKPTRADEQDTVIVTLDAQGGSVESTSLTAARTTSFSFTSWNTKADGSGDSYAPSSKYTANASATLYAQWKSSTTAAPVTLPTPSREGYRFLGWATGTTAASGVTGSFMPEESLTMYAIWEKIDGTIQMGDETSRPGNEILVPVILDNELGMYVISFHVNYDSAVLKLAGVEDGSLSGWRCSTNSGYVRWDAPEDSNKSASGVIAKLRFQVIEDAADGVTDVTIDDLEILNRDEYAFTIAVIPGAVSINSRMAGDANGDGEVDILDLIRLRKFLMHDTLDIKEGNAEVTGDGNVNNADLVRLRKYLVGVATLD